MLLLGHIGLTLAAGKTGEAAYDKVSRGRVIPGSGLFDYRLLAVAALLPDLIDKPLLLFPLPEALDISRSLGHSLGLPLLLMVLWWATAGRTRKIALTLAVGSLLHLVLDGVITTPQTLLWPILGWEFEHNGPSDLFTSLPIPWELPWNLSWLALSELLGAIAGGVVGLMWWRDRRGRYSPGGIAPQKLPLGPPAAESSAPGS